jgi:hypothetical protein
MPSRHAVVTARRHLAPGGRDSYTTSVDATSELSGDGLADAVLSDPDLIEAAARLCSDAEADEVTAVVGDIAGDLADGLAERVPVPDLDDDLPADFAPLEEALVTLETWETQSPDEDGDELEPMELPWPLADGVALAALQRVMMPLHRSQGKRAVAAGATGRLLTPATARDLAVEPGRLVERARSASSPCPPSTARCWPSCPPR